MLHYLHIQGSPSLIRHATRITFRIGIMAIPFDVAWRRIARFVYRQDNIGHCHVFGGTRELEAATGTTRRSRRLD